MHARLVLIVVVALAAGCKKPSRGSCERHEGITVALASTPTTLDWNRSHDSSWSNYPVLLATMQGLTMLDAEHQVVPGLAERWDVTTTPEGHQVLTFHLRRDVVWSDGTTPLTADDFVFGWRRAILGHQPVELRDLVGAAEVLALRANDAMPAADRERALAEALARLAVEAVDDHTLRVTLESPRTYFLARLSSAYQMFPAPSALLAGKSEEEIRRYFDEPTATSPAVVGPYRIASWDRVAKQVELARNPHWTAIPGAAGAMTDRLTLVQADLAPLLYDQCKVDFVLMDDPAALAHAGADLQRRPLMSVYWLGINAAKVDPRLRRAIGHALDRPALTAGLLPEARPAFGLLPHDIGLPGAVAPDDAEAASIGAPAHDPELARRLVAESGYRGEELVLLVRGTGTFLPETGIADAIRRQLAGVGINVRVKTTSDFSGDVKHADGSTRVDLFLRRTGADYAHPQTFFTAFDPNGNHGTEWHRADPSLAAGFVELLARAGAVTDPAEMKAGYAAAQRFLLAEQAVVVPLFYPDRYFRRRPWLEGIDVDPFNFLVLRGPAAAEAR